MQLKWLNPFKRTYTARELSYIRFLGHTPLFKGLEKKELLLLIQKMHEREYTREEVIYFRNDPALAIYVVKQGRVELCFERDDAFEPVKAVIETGIFGEAGLLPNTRRIFNAIARSEKVTLYIFPQEALKELFENEVKMKNKVLENFLKIQYNLEFEIFRKLRKTGGFFDITQMMED